MDGAGIADQLHAPLTGQSTLWTAPDVLNLATDQKGAYNCQAGAAAPDPAAYGLSPPLFRPLTAYAARGTIFQISGPDGPVQYTFPS